MTFGVLPRNFCLSSRHASNLADRCEPSSLLRLEKCLELEAMRAQGLDSTSESSQGLGDRHIDMPVGAMR